MGKLLNRLESQLNTEYKQDAENCLKLYRFLLESTGHIWESDWRFLVSTVFKGFPSDERRFIPTKIGYTVLKGIQLETLCKKAYVDSWERTSEGNNHEYPGRYSSPVEEDANEWIKENLKT